MSLLAGLVSQWWHCLLGMFKDCRAITIYEPSWGDRPIVELRCECGKVFYSVPEEDRWKA